MNDTQDTPDEQAQREASIKKLEAISNAYTVLRKALLTTAEKLQTQHSEVRQHLAEAQAGDPLREPLKYAEVPELVESFFTPEFQAAYARALRTANAPKAKTCTKVLEEGLEGAAKDMLPGDPVEMLSNEQSVNGPAVGYCVANDGVHCALQFADDIIEEFDATRLEVKSAVLPVDERNGRTLWRLK